MFHVQIDAAQVESLLAALREELAGLGLRYWLTPMHAAGVIE